jgi:hypothetical protein
VVTSPAFRCCSCDAVPAAMSCSTPCSCQLLCTTNCCECCTSSYECVDNCSGGSAIHKNRVTIIIVAGGLSLTKAAVACFPPTPTLGPCKQMQGTHVCAWCVSVQRDCVPLEGTGLSATSLQDPVA